MQRSVHGNGIHLIVRAHLGGKHAGKSWLPVPEEGVNPRILPDVQDYLGDYSASPPQLEVDEPTWESVELEVYRIKERERKEKEEEQARKMETFTRLASAYLEGGPHFWPTKHVAMTISQDETSVYIEGCGRSIDIGVDSELVKQIVDKHKQLRIDADERERKDREDKQAALREALPRLLSGEGTISDSSFQLDDKTYWLDSRFEESEQILQEKKRREEEASRKFKEEEVAWIKKNGSTRLLKAFDVGAYYHGIYLDERLAKEAPGWVYKKVCSFEEVLNPSEALLDAYIKALETWKDAKMGFRPREELTVVYMKCPWRSEYYLILPPMGTGICTSAGPDAGQGTPPTDSK